MSSFLDSLHVTLQEAADGLPGVASRKMFGCHALFRGSQIFALVWQDGRLGLRLPDASAFDVLAGEAGAAAWTIAKGDGRRMTMGKWLLVPEAWNDGGEELEAWVRKAHTLAGTAAKAPPAKKKPSAAKKKPTAAKKNPPAAKKKPSAAKKKPTAAKKPAARAAVKKR